MFDYEYFPVLETERCRLRHIEDRDADQILALYGSEEVMRYLILEPPCDSRERALEEIRFFHRMFDERKGVRWAITLRDDDRLIGTVGFHFWLKEHHRCDLGYDLIPAYWGRGYVTEVSRAVIGWCFTNLELHRVQADCTSGNIASERVLEKLGFTLEGEFRESIFEHGRFVNIKQYGLLRREFMRE